MQWNCVYSGTVAFTLATHSGKKSGKQAVMQRNANTGRTARFRQKKLACGGQMKYDID